MPVPPRLIFLLNSAQRRLQHALAQRQQQAASDGASVPSPAQAGVLFLLASGDGARMGNIAQALDLAPSAVSGLVQRLEALAWVQRRADTGDARTQRVWLLPAGQAQLPALRAALRVLNAELAAGFSAAELQTVARWLHHVQALGVAHPADDEPAPR